MDSNKLVITHYKDYILSVQFENGTAVKINAEKTTNKSILGNIYIGKVKNLVKNIEAAFVEIENGVICFFPFSDLNNVIFLNEKKDYTKLVPGDEIVVQVTKDPINDKAPVVSGKLNISGKYSVIIHNDRGISVSEKIKEKKSINFLKNVFSDYASDQYGIIIRTNAYDISEDILKDEIEKLIGIYKDIIKNSVYRTAFSKLYEAPLAYITDIRDSYSFNINEIVTDDRCIYDNIKQYLYISESHNLDKLKFYDDETIGLKELLNIESIVNDALKKKVWLKSGGTIVIEPTEALVSIDVNTSKSIIGKQDAEKAFLKTNLEACKEIARQLRLRNLGGIIIIDFIDMKKEEDKQLLFKEFSNILKADPIKTIVVDYTKLNLIEVTRKKVRKSLYQQLRDI
ncbi:MAG: ribonuclease E/G [Lachnospiraceae bacterium]|nr:ribonuclease E/G [Lachnospiraceae bacterium]